ncbi:asparagine synthase (glutamine-hydrolyzing) [bacterium]|nr:asparagine synthase (glutamine-hydrolyzing) [bacterium]
MCGIVGIYKVNNSSEVSEKTLIEMRDTLTHRGPDDEGLYISSDRKLGLGFRRLAIIDLSPAGAEPMTNEDKSLWLVFNGEVYNFPELKKELIKKGHKFHSHTDAEVILHLYEERGEKLINELNGMYAFVLWDEKKKKLLAVRDRLGIKPFYYYFQQGVFIFASEIKALLKHSLLKKEPDLEGIFHYLTFACTPAPYTLFKNIRKLAPAHYLTLDKRGNMELKRYWSPASVLSSNLSLSEREQEQYFISKTRSLLQESIEKQMVSDVPFGCFLSGGIDSSTNAVLMSRAMGKPVETFSISFKDLPQYDEFVYSRKIAQILGSKRHEIVIGKEEFEQWLPQLAFYADDPNGDPVCFPVFYLSKLIRDSGVIMAQVGEGSDELFCGYNTYMEFIKIWRRYWRWGEKTPQFIKVIPYLLLNSLLSPQRLKLHKEFLRRLAQNKPLFYGGANAFSAYDKQFLLMPSFRKKIPPASSDVIIENVYKDLDNQISNLGVGKVDFLQKMLYLELNIRLPELLLMRVDKMAMANSIETRVPFLDHRLVELAFSIPMKLKIKNDTTKYILKKAVKGIIPDEIINRPKKGFGAPVGEWMRDDSDIKDRLFVIIRHSKIKELNIFDYNYIENLISDHCNRRTDNSFRLWNLITLSLWYDKWMN